MPPVSNHPAIKEILVLLEDGRFVSVDLKNTDLIAWTQEGVAIIEAYYAKEKHPNKGSADKAWNGPPPVSRKILAASATPLAACVRKDKTCNTDALI